MTKIPAASAAQLFEEIFGWPYASPGTNDRRGIDCSGAWTRVYRTYGKYIYHGSNRQFREYCAQTGKITSTDELQVGMAVFKVRQWTESQRGHRDYGAQPGDLYHVGCVTGINPLRIVHATPPAAKVDKVLGNWAYYGLLKEVDYDGIVVVGDAGLTVDPVEQATAPPRLIEPAIGQAVVVTQTSNLNLRSSPSDANRGNILNSMPPGTLVTVLEQGETWTKVRYMDRRNTPHVGYAATEYLECGIRN